MRVVSQSTTITDSGARLQLRQYLAHGKFHSPDNKTNYSITYILHISPRNTIVKYCKYMCMSRSYYFQKLFKMLMCDITGYAYNLIFTVNILLL